MMSIKKWLFLPVILCLLFGFLACPPPDGPGNTPEPTPEETPDTIPNPTPTPVPQAALTQIDLYFYLGNSVTGTFTIELRNADGSSVLWTNTVNVSQLSGAWVAFPIPNISLIVGQIYRIYIIRSDATDSGSGNYIAWTLNDTNPYSSGRSSILPDGDFQFRTYNDIGLDQESTGVTVAYYVSNSVYMWQEFTPSEVVPTPEPTPEPTPVFESVYGNYTVRVCPEGDVCSVVMPSAEYLRWYNAERAAGDTQNVTQALYQFFNDNYDFIAFVNNESDYPSSGYAGQFTNVSNSVTGGGLGIFDNTAAYGSYGKLQGVIHLRRRYITNGPSLHEICHNWAAYISFLGSVHWGFSNAGGQLGGWESGTLTDLGGGQYEADGPVGHDYFGEVANGGNGLPYSTLELYLMGLIGASEVTQDIKKAENPAWVDSSQGIFTATSITTCTIGDIITQYGARSPDYLSSQKNFSMLLVLVSDIPPIYNDYLEAGESLYNFSLTGDDGNASVYNFWEATGGRATLSMGNIVSDLK